MSELVDKYDRKLLTVKEKKYIVPVVEVAVGASSIFFKVSSYRKAYRGSDSVYVGFSISN